MVVLSLKMKEIIVFSDYKRRKPWQVLSWVITCSKSRFGVTYFLERIMLLFSMTSLFIDEARYYEDMTRRS